METPRLLQRAVNDGPALAPLPLTALVEAARVLEDEIRRALEEAPMVAIPYVAQAKKQALLLVSNLAIASICEREERDDRALAENTLRAGSPTPETAPRDG